MKAENFNRFINKREELITLVESECKYFNRWHTSNLSNLHIGLSISSSPNCNNVVLEINNEYVGLSEDEFIKLCTKKTEILKQVKQKLDNAKITMSQKLSGYERINELEQLIDDINNENLIIIGHLEKYINDFMKNKKNISQLESFDDQDKIKKVKGFNRKELIILVEVLGCFKGLSEFGIDDCTVQSDIIAGIISRDGQNVRESLTYRDYLNENSLKKVIAFLEGIDKSKTIKLKNEITKKLEKSKEQSSKLKVKQNRK